jgi:DNA-directed RNA polymerase specialized sigma subunit
MPDGFYSVDDSDIPYSLDEKTRKVVNLRLQDLTQREIVQIVGLSQAEISRTLGRAKKKFENSNEGEMII